MSILALSRDALHWEAAVRALKLGQGQKSCPGEARLCCVFIAWLRVPRASDPLSNMRVTSSLAATHNFSSPWLLFSFLLCWLVSSLLSAMLPCGWGQVGGKDRGVPWDGDCVPLCCPVNPVLLGPGSALLPASESDGIPPAPTAAVRPRLSKQSIETLEGSHIYGSAREKKIEQARELSV